MKRCLTIVLTTIVLLASWQVFKKIPPVQAEEIVYKKHTVVDFGDDTVEGDLSRPDGQYLESRKRLKYQKLLKLRKHFRLEILNSVRHL